MGKDGVTRRSGPGCDAQGRAQPSQDPDKTRGWGTTGVLESLQGGIVWHIPACQVHKDSHFRAPKQRANLDLRREGESA